MIASLRSFGSLISTSQCALRTLLKSYLKRMTSILTQGDLKQAFLRKQVIYTKDLLVL